MITQDIFGCIANTIKVAAGHYVDLANPDPETIDIVSIATSLGRICRFGGHCPRFYSVAEHCAHAFDLAREDGCSTDILKAVLLHDAAEAYIGDVVKPLKAILPGYAEIEKRIEAAIAVRFGVDFESFEPAVKHYDRLMLKAEKIDMWPDDPHQWHGFDTIDHASVAFCYYSHRYASRAFFLRCMDVGIELKNGA